MEVDYTQFGLAGLCLGIIFFIVKYFIENSQKKDSDLKELTEKFIAMTERAIEVQSDLSKSIEANTAITKAAATESDRLSQFMLKVFQSKKITDHTDDHL